MLQLASSSLSLNWDEALLRIALAGVLGGLIGLERELRERQAGLRTHLLVAVGAALFTIAGAYGFVSGFQSGHTDDGADHKVGIGMSCNANRSRRAVHHVDSRDSGCL